VLFPTPPFWPINVTIMGEGVSTFGAQRPNFLYARG
jgi:hypothetical protein